LFERKSKIVVGRDESEDVLVPQHHGLVDLALSGPRLLIPAVEDLHGNVLASPVAQPHLAESVNYDKSYSYAMHS